MITDFWKNKKVLVTGHTGFKGGWLSLWLARLGANVTGISLAPHTTPNLFKALNLEKKINNYFFDIRDASRLAKLFFNSEPEVVFHLGAQALVRASYDDPLKTFSSNIMGTANVLESMRGLSSVQAGIIVTTDKVYRNNEWVYPYRENDFLGGHDPYSASKVACEHVVDCYRKSFFVELGVPIASARAGNVIGGGDWADERLLPDAVRAWQHGESICIRRPQAVRPWQHVLEPLFGYLVLAEKLCNDPSLAGAYNFGPHTYETVSVRQIIELARDVFGSGKVEYGAGNEGPHEAGLLALETSKSRTVLKIAPCWALDEAVKRTMLWYKSFLLGADAVDLCLHDIEDYEALI